MTDFVDKIRTSIQLDWKDLREILSHELKNRAGTISRSRYMVVGGLIHQAIKRDPHCVTDQLQPFLDADTKLTHLNTGLFFALFNEYVESLLHNKEHQQTSSYGDCKPSASLLATLETVLALETKRRGKHGGVLFWQGVTDHLKENRTANEAAFLKAATYQSFGFELPKSLCGARTVRASQDTAISLTDTPLVSSKLRFLAQNSTGAEELVIFTCADDAYFKAFWRGFLTSVDNLNQNICVHIHIATSKPEELDFAVLYELKNINVDVSTSSKDGVKDNSWYTVLRWLLLEEVLKHYNKLVIVSDFDVEYQAQNFRKYIEVMTQYDLGLNINAFPQNRFPWTTINANQLACAPGKASGIFVSELKQKTLQFFNPKRSDQWWIDQNILFSCYRDLMNSRASVKVFNNYHLPVKTIINKKNAAKNPANANR